jgi:hypothetical protein
MKSEIFSLIISCIFFISVFIIPNILFPETELSLGLKFLITIGLGSLGCVFLLSYFEIKFLGVDELR